MPGAGMVRLLYLAAILVLSDGLIAPATTVAGSFTEEVGTPAASPTPVWIGRPFILSGHTGPVTELAWSPDGAILASSSGNVAADGTADPTVRLWSARGERVATLREHADSVTDLAWSPDGRILASGSRDHTARLWSAQGTLLATIDADAGPVLSLAWSPDGEVLAVGSIAPWESRFDKLNGVVRLFDRDGALLDTLRTDPGGGKWLHLAWAPDGQTLAAGAWGFRMWRRDGTLIAAIERYGSPAPAMAWSPDGRLLATGNEDGVVSLYAPAGEPVARITGNGSIRSLAFSPDGSALAVMGNSFVRLVNAHDPDAEPVLVHRNPGDAGSNVAWSPDGEWLAAQAPDSMLRYDIVRLWRADGIPLAVLEGCGNRIDVVAWSPDGRTLAAGSRGHTVCLWRWDDGEACLIRRHAS